MKRPFPLYHWSPRSRRASILKRGFVPGSWSKDHEWKPPYICFSDSPSLAWGLSAGCSEIYGEWDLWMMWSDEPSGFETLNTGVNRSGKPTEYRVYERVFMSQLWRVGSREHQKRKSAKCATNSAS